MTERVKDGHRQRLKERFLAGAEESKSDDALLEILLFYAIPQRDVKPLARTLLARFGTLGTVLAADPAALCEVDGVKESTVALLKVVDRIRARPREPVTIQGTLFPDASEPMPKHSKESGRHSRGAELFSNAALREAIAVLPHLPHTTSMEAARTFVRSQLHFSGEATRARYSAYIVRRLFPNGQPDEALQIFAQLHQGQVALKDAAFYRFCLAEPLLSELISAVLLPSIGKGKVNRAELRDYLRGRFPESKSIQDGAQAVVEALTAGGIATADKLAVYFGYRDIQPASFAFVLHSEFTPGMYDFTRLTENKIVRSMLWDPDKLIPSLYELRNCGILSKVSEIDSLRQFTVRYDLMEVIRALARDKQPA